MRQICRNHIRSFAGLCLVGILSVVACWGQNGSPKLFAPGVISGPADDLSPAFTPDGKMVFFTRGNPSGSIIVESEFVNGAWTAAHTAPFSGRWNDLEPAMSPDGAFLVFASNRPAQGGSKAIDGRYNGKVFPQAGGNLWRVDRKDGRWGEPYRLPETINRGSASFSPSICSDGSLYFMLPDEKTGYFHLYRSQYRSGEYLAADRISIGDDGTEDVDPAVAPDETFLVYSSNRPAQHGPKRLKIVQSDGGKWGTPIDLGDEINEAGSNIEARLAPDLRTLYFSTNTAPPASYPRTAEELVHLTHEMEVWANGSENIWYVPLPQQSSKFDIKHMREPAGGVLAKDDALPVATLFAPGIVSGPGNDGAPTFSPDGKTILFTRNAAHWSVILQSHLTEGRWSTPIIASFSGKWPDSSPAWSPDGTYVVFQSTRPTQPLRSPLQPGKPIPGVAANLWRVDLTSTGWGEPIRLPDTVNISSSVWKPTVASNGNIYFTVIGPSQEKSLYLAARKNDGYEKATVLPFSGGAMLDVDPEIAPDESFLVFSSAGRIKGDTHERLFFVLRDGSTWGVPKLIRYQGDVTAYGPSIDNEPKLARDEETLYFSSDRSVPVHFPRSQQQAERDLERLTMWDNSNANVWAISLKDLLPGKK